MRKQIVKSPEYMDHRSSLQRQWRRDNKERYEAARRRRTIANYERYLFNAAKTRSKVRGVDFAISLEDIPPMGTHCPLLGHPFSAPHSGSPFAPSLDRIDSRFGYVKGNVWIVGRRANMIKNDGTAEEHEQIARAMRAVEAAR